MKSRSTCYLLVTLSLSIVLPQSASAQLLPDQRVFDFQNLAALYSKRYAPYDWKRQALGFDALNIKSWLDRVRAAKDDLEFFEIEEEYAANLQDTHTGVQMPSSFRAYLGGSGPSAGMYVDIYDGKVLIDSLNRSLLPSGTYPFQVGDEIVSVDGVSSEDWIKRVSTWRRYGNPATTRRFASQQIVTRAQSTFPRAFEIGDTAVVEVRRDSGVLETYRIPWAKTGIPVITVGPVPTPRTAALGSQTSQPDYLQTLEALHNYKLPEADQNFYVSIGSRTPHFRNGFPTSFVQRLGRSGSEFHYSGTYTADDLAIGYLRIPSFSSSGSTVINELKSEIEYFQNNTDGLVIDVTRNPGGGCYMLDVAATLIPYPFYFFGEQIRATQDRLNSFQSLLDSARLSHAEQWVIDSYQRYVDQMKAALAANRGMTEPIPACRQTGSSGAPISYDNQPSTIVYTKPLIVLIDELSISAADIFPSMLQDNRRGLLVGARSSGGGGSVSGYPSGLYSETYSSNTNTLVVRKKAISTAEYPAAPYVENIGARPDVPLEFMTRENLLNGGRTYVDQFTRILTKEIRAVPLEKHFALADAGAVSWVTPESSGPASAGFARIRADGASTTPGGMAIFGFRENGVLVTEAAVPAAPAIRSGRIYAEVGGTVNTGIAIANPNYAPATVSFFFTGADGDFGAGSMEIPANGQIAAFLDQPPFNGPKTLIGTFSFSSSSSIATVALRGVTNERGEFLITTLPVADLAAKPTAGSTPVFPHLADGGEWHTEVMLVNPTDSTMAGTVLFKDQSGAELTLTVNGRSDSRFPYSLAPRMALKLATSATTETLQSGYIVVLPADQSAPPVGSALFSMRQNGITISQAATPAMDAAPAFRLYAESAGEFNNGAVGSMQTGLAIVNRSTAAADVRVELFRPDGSSTGVTGTLSLPAQGQVARFLYQIPGLESVTSTFQGVVRVSSHSPLSVAGLRGRYNERGDFLITTTPSVDEAIAPADADMIFPHFVQGGGYTTQFVLLAGAAGQQSTGALRFLSQSGELLDLALR